MNITVVFGVLIFLLCASVVNTNHFQGGTITYKIVNTYGSTVSIMITQTYLYKWSLIYCDNSYILSQSSPNITGFSEYNYTLNCVANCTTTGGYQPVPVRSYCTDYSSAMAISVTQRTDIVNLTSGAYFTVAFTSTAWRKLSLPIGGPANKNWSIACTIDLRARSDTGKLNTPPVANMISPIYIPVGVQSSLLIPTIDGDNDVVRCRFANKITECSDACPPSSLPNATIIISSNCTMFITGTKANDWYAVTIQIEDFANANSTTPLSSVPVQFLINVYATPNCTVAPVLYGSSNQTGACQNVQVGQPQSLTLYAINYCNLFSVTINDIATLSFPIVKKTNITKLTSSLYSVTLTWTPTASQVGSQILCAVAIDSQNVQSNQYCTAFSVNENNTAACPGQVTATTARDTSMTTATTMHTTVITTGTAITTTSATYTFGLTTFTGQSTHHTVQTTTAIIQTTTDTTDITTYITQSAVVTTDSTTIITESTTATVQTTVVTPDSTLGTNESTTTVTESTTETIQNTAINTDTTAVSTESTPDTTEVSAESTSDTTEVSTESTSDSTEVSAESISDTTEVSTESTSDSTEVTADTVPSTAVTTINNSLALTSDTTISNSIMSSTIFDTTSFMITQQISNQSTLSIDSSTTSFNTLQSTTDLTSQMTTTADTTTASSPSEWSWLLPLLIALAALLALLCCLCLCCALPHALGLLFPKRRRVTLQPPNTGPSRRIPRMFMVSKTLGKDFDNLSRSNSSSLATPRSTTESDICLNMLSSTPRNSTSKGGKNGLWAYPSPRFH